jgi:8-oxo-dGTP diphosphatase
LEAACRRELKEETGVDVRDLKLVGVYSDPKRDPRGHTCSVAYLARVDSAEPTAGDDAAAAEWVADWRSEKLAFDHADILADAATLRARS